MPGRRRPVLTRSRYLALYVIISRCRMKLGTGRHIEAWRTERESERERGQKNTGAKRRGLEERVDCEQYSWQWVIRLCRFMTAARISGQFRSGLRRPRIRTLRCKSFNLQSVLLRNSVFFGKSIERTAVTIIIVNILSMRLIKLYAINLR